jgi:membrane fusion protein (multidrug efflux system)
VRIRFTSFGVLRSVFAAVLFAVLATLLMLWLAGWFSPKVDTRSSTVEDEPLPPPNVTSVEARMIRLPLTESAVGTVQAQHETTIASRILARVVEINLKAGQQVKRGEVLVRLDDTDLKARLRQEQAATDAARALRDNAAADDQRYLQALQTKSVSQLQYDLAAATLRSHEASLAQAKQGIAEAQAVLEYATICSPMDGIVVDKRVDVGDTTTPGQPLLTLYDPRQMQLVANVRDSLTRRLTVGQSIEVRLGALDKTYTGQVSEMVPDSQSASRTFQVKVTGPFPAGLYTGMFGRIFIPLDEQELLVIPASAIRHIGQLELVDVLDGGIIRRRAVRSGQVIGTDCEVLSGLQTGEKVVVPAPHATQPVSTQPAQGVQP